MISISYSRSILFRLLVIITLAIGVSWSVFLPNHSSYIIPLGILLIIAVYSTFRYFNRINRQISYFFSAVKNDDYTLQLPRKIKDPIIEDLYHQMTEVNLQIQKIRIENRQFEQYFQSMLEHSATGIFSFDPRGFVIHANSAFRMMIGRDVFTHISQLEQIDNKLYNTVRDIKPSEHKLVALPTERGTIQLSLKAAAFKNGEEELMLLSVQDIHHELDEKELDSWLKLIRVLMHEIMNSIAPITSLSESLAGYFKKEGKVKTPEEIDEKVISTTLKGLEVIRGQGTGLMSFVESYRRLTRLPAPNLQPVRIADLIENIVMLSRSFDPDSGVRFRTKCSDPDLEWMADEKLLTQVLINLLKNSVQALSDRENPVIEITAGLNSSSHLEIFVKDNGPGIPKELMDQIFVPFFTTRESGSGIGLSLSRQIMRLHGGSLTVRSVPNQETVFCMRF
ncbi:MAG: ATP-binding protein [Bacteroidales bacterium]|nr:ATP-binding protein [Bacteroidales bacterium]